MAEESTTTEAGTEQSAAARSTTESNPVAKDIVDRIVSEGIDGPGFDFGTLEDLYAGDRGESTEETEEGQVEDGAAPAATKTVTEDADDKEHPLIKLMRGGAAPAEKAVEVPAPVQTWLKSQGIEDVSAFMAEVPQLREQNAALTKKAEEATKNLSFLEKLSPEARNVLAMDLDGKDWKKEVIEARPHDIKYQLTFEKQDKKVLAEAYAKGEITDDQWEDYNDSHPDPMNKKYIDAVLKRVEIQYNGDRQASVSYSDNRNKEIKERNDKHEKSHSATMAYVHKVVPGSEAYAEDIKKSLADLQSLFFEEDGVSYKPDAGLNAWLIANKDLVLGTRDKRIVAQAKDDATMDLVKRMPAKDAAKKLRSDGGGSVEKTAEQIASDLMREAWNI